ncbi:hypothetical protein WAB17_13445 [Parerythrobacter aurantius]|uniref:hypothetical protein n=1 Tax=Parerythrobacter aurantius TaxID=3127706 RepID=UPI00324A3C55
MDANETVGNRVDLIFAEFRRLAMAASGTLVVTTMVLALGNIAVDLFFTSSVSNLFLGIVSLAIDFIVLRALLRNSGLVSGDLNGQVGTYFGLALLSAIGLTAGLVLLVIPGLVLAVRWSAIYGYGLVDGDGIANAMGKSWDATGPHFTPIAISLLVPIGIYAVSIAGLFWSVRGFGEVNLPLSILGNVGLAIGGNVFATVGIAVYSLTADRSRTLAAVFE